MAAWGQGDPRWLVEERTDGKNVNGWHWEEKCILSQVKSWLSENFTNVTVDLGQQQGQLVLKQCRDISGEAKLNTRKGNKRVCLYDLKMTLEWEATVFPSNKTVSGTIKVDEICNGSEEDDYVVEATVTGSGSEENIGKRLAEKEGKAEVVRRLLVLDKQLQDV